MASISQEPNAIVGKVPTQPRYKRPLFAWTQAQNSPLLREILNALIGRVQKVGAKEYMTRLGERRCSDVFTAEIGNLLNRGMYDFIDYEA